MAGAATAAVFGVRWKCAASAAGAGGARAGSGAVHHVARALPAPIAEPSRPAEPEIRRPAVRAAFITRG